MTLTTFLIEFGVAVGLGLLIGLEREFGHHPAGLRTNALVCGGAALYVLLARSIDHGADTARVAAQIVSGIGFLGGGVILREGLTVQGLTTAATLWCTAAIGSLCGADLLNEAGIATSAILMTNYFFNPVSRWIDRRVAKRASTDITYRLTVNCVMAKERHVRHLLAQQIAAQHDIILQGIGIQSTGQADCGLVVADVEMRVRDEHILQDIVEQLNLDPATSAVHWERQA